MKKELIEQLERSFEVKDLFVKDSYQAYITVEKKRAVALITHLKEVEGYKHLSFLTAVDQIEKGYFELIYMLHSYRENHDLAVVVKLGRVDEDMFSMHHLWPAVETYQRELREMFGINFPGSPGIERSFCLEGWDNIPPMRREFDTLAYSEETYYERPGRETHDPTEYMKEKMYPSEAETW